MVTIKLFCSAGMSTSMLVSRMRKAAEAKGIEANIEAFPEATMANHLDGLDVALLGPQIGYTLPKAKTICDPAGVTVAVIDTIDYGMMNGEKVLDFALNLAKDKK